MRWIMWLFVYILLLAVNTLPASCGVLDKRPNVLLILTDDQDAALKGMDPMRNVKKLIADRGATFDNAYTSSPLCCPSRASLLTGKYPQNHHTHNNSLSGGCYGSQWRSNLENRTIATLLSTVGYRTFYGGKYLNQYTGAEVPAGWLEFYGLHGNSRYYNYTLRENERNVSYADVYLTDLLRDKVINFLETHSKLTPDQPFFAMIAPPAPHAPYTPAQRHRDVFNGTRAPRTPSYNKVDKEKHWLVASSKQIPDYTLNLMDSYFQKRWESLLAVDELVADVIEKLNDIGELDNTYVIYTSDNGYHIGQFAMPFDKRQPYETDIHIPLIIRGPSIRQGVHVTAAALLIDLLPTILEWPNIPVDPLMDGQSLHAFLTNAPFYNALQDRFYTRGMLVRHYGEGNFHTYKPECKMWQPTDRLAECTEEAACHCQDGWNNTYACVRNFAYGINHLYCEFQDNEDFVEFYDLDEDPHQLQNTGRQMLPIERGLYSLALQKLTTCVGVSQCNVRVF